MVNYGGVRLIQLPAGNLTVGKMYELMPFDNLLVIQKLKGDIVQKFLDRIASSGGWPISGITFQIKDKKAVNINVGGKPFNINNTYTIANSDFVINGGDSDNILKGIPFQNIGYNMRDALIEYVTKMKKISVKEENRISNAQ
jgi:2',3'-cyclic-nucleotide 2'-phosphodiesterase (5'-nucleotidase family)